MSEQQADNLYAPPAAVVDDATNWDSDDHLIIDGRTVPAGHGVNWISGGWEMFKANPGAWIAMSLIFMAIYIVMSIIPLLKFLNIFLLPILGGGMAIACANQRKTGELRVADLFAGFRQNTGALVMVGLIAFAIIITILAIFGGIIGFGAFFGGMRHALDARSIIAIVTFVLIVLIVIFLVYAAMWYAPALITQHDLSALEAMQMSFKGSMRNVWSGLVYALVLAVLGIFATIPVLLGWLVLWPVMFASLYVSYRDIFVEE